MNILNSLPTERFAIAAYTPFATRNFNGTVGDYVRRREFNSMAVVIQTGTLSTESGTINVRLRLRTEEQQAVNSGNVLYQGLSGADSSSRNGALLVQSNRIYVLPFDSSLAFREADWTSPSAIESNRIILQRGTYTFVTYSITSGGGNPSGFFSVALFGFSRNRPASIFNSSSAEIVS